MFDTDVHGHISYRPFFARRHWFHGQAALARLL